jgi:hypothetical protein
MIFELKNKIPRNSSFLRSVDVLTSTVFGNLRYFKDQTILIKFLNESINLSRNKLMLPNSINFEIKFWEKYYNDSSRRYNETDLTLIGDNNIIIIECKYHSPLSEECETENNYSNQLIRYSKILDEKAYENMNKFIIFLTNDKIMPREILLRSSNGIERNIGLFWLSWSKLFSTLMEYDSNKLSSNELLLYNDLLSFLNKRNIISFRNFIISDIVCNYHYRKQYQYINSSCKNQWHYKRCYYYITKKQNLNWRYLKNE